MAKNLKTWNEVSANLNTGVNNIPVDPCSRSNAFVEVKTKGVLRNKKTVKVGGKEVVTVPKSVADVAAKGITEGMVAAVSYIVVSSALNVAGNGVKGIGRKLSGRGGGLSKKFQWPKGKKTTDVSPTDDADDDLDDIDETLETFTEV